DAHPDPAAAMAGAAADHPDVLFGPYGSSPAVAAIGATDRAVWNHGGATSKLCRPRYANAVNLPAPAATYFDGALRAVRAADPEAATVVLLRGATGFAADVGAGALATAGACGFSAVERVFEPGRAAEVAEAAPAADVLLVAGRLDLTTFYGRFRLDPVTGLQDGHEVLTVQWQKGVRRVVWPPDRAERPLIHHGG